MDTSADQARLDILRSQRRGVLATLRRNGHAQQSVVGYDYDEHARLARISVTEDRAKTRNLRRDPRASLLVPTEALGAYVVVEGEAELTPPAADPHDATVEELVALFRALQGEHPDWEEYRAAMVADRRLVVRLPLEHVYGWSPED